MCIRLYVVQVIELEKGVWVWKKKREGQTQEAANPREKKAGYLQDEGTRRKGGEGEGSKTPSPYENTIRYPSTLMLIKNPSKLVLFFFFFFFQATQMYLFICASTHMRKLVLKLNLSSASLHTILLVTALSSYRTKAKCPHGISTILTTTILQYLLAGRSQRISRA